MKQYGFLPLVVCATMVAAPAKAMPVAPIAVQSVSLLIASGCGLGVRRGPFDGCETVYDGNYAAVRHNPYNHYYIGFARGGFCGGRDTQLACNNFGLCRVVCN
jgi:hypothetical protein